MMLRRDYSFHQVKLAEGCERRLWEEGCKEYYCALLNPFILTGKEKMQKHENTEFVPGFICRQHRMGLREGVIEGSVLVSDISGFTGLTESLFGLQKHGAERLSHILNGLFAGMIEAVHRHGGFVASFAGDAFTAVFPGDDGSGAYSSSQEIRNLVSGKEKNHITGITSGIDTGDIQWNIYGSGPFTYLFSGQAVQRAAFSQASAETGEIAMASGVREPGKPRIPSPSSPPCGSLTKLFVHKDFIAEADSPEFRDVASVFTSFDEIDDMDGFTDTIIRTAQDYGGYFNLLDCGDKGKIVLTIFGAPLSSGKNARRSVNFALDLRERYGVKTRSGITYGRVFAGFIGSEGVRGHYTVIGDKVNTAARLMEICPPGEIRISGGMGRSAGNLFQLERFPGPPERRVLLTQPCYSVIGRAAQSGTPLFSGEFIGRKDELESIVSFAEKTRSENRTGVLLVEAEAGMGKTRLLWEARQLLENTALIYLKCDEILAKSLNPIETFFEDVFGTSGLEDPDVSEAAFEQSFSSLTGTPGYHGEKLKKLKHVVKGFMGIHESPEYAILDGKSRFDNTILSFIHLAGLITWNRRPFIVVDDFQWVDPDTLSALKDVFTQMDMDHPLIALLYRPSRGHRAEDAVSPAASELTIILPPMEKQDQMDLMDNSLPRPPSDTLRRTIAEKAEGNPFFIEQMLKYLIDSKLLDFSGDMAELTSQAVELPGSIIEVIISRVDSLEEEIRQTVKRASVLGRSFNIRVLSRMLRGIQIEGHLCSALEAGLWNRLSELQYIFSHGLIREAVYGMQMEGQLSKLHLLAGEIIEELYGGDERMFTDLSYHFEKSGRKASMLEYTLKAAAYAGDNFRNREAVEMYEKYIANQPDPLKLKEAKLKLAGIYELTADWQAALSLFDQIISSSKEEADKPYLAEALCRKGFITHRLAENARALECLSLAEEAFTELEDENGLARVRNNIGIVYIDLNNYDEAISVLESALAHSQKDDEESREIAMFICSNLGLIYQRMNHLDKAAGYFRRSIEAGEPLNRRRNIALLNLGNVKYLQGKVNEAEAIYRDAMEIAGQMGDRHVARVLMNNIAAIHSARGEFTEALDMFTGALNLARRMNDRKGMRLLNQSIGEIKSFLGDYTGSGESLTRAVEIAEELGDERAIGSVLGKTGQMLMMKGDTSGATERLREAIRFSTNADDLQSAWEFMFALARIIRSSENADGLQELAKSMEDIPESRVAPGTLWLLPVIRMWAEKASGNPEKALEIAADTAERFPGTEGEAAAWLTSFEITGNDTHRLMALKAYTAVYESTPIALYREIINSLS